MKLIVYNKEIENTYFKYFRYVCTTETFLI